MRNRLRERLEEGRGPNVQSPPAGRLDPLSRTKELGQHAVKLVGRYPAACLTAALIGGVMLGVWIKRR